MTIKNRNIYCYQTQKMKTLMLPGCAVRTDSTFNELAKSQAQECEEGIWKSAQDFLAGAIHQIRVCSS